MKVQTTFELGSLAMKKAGMAVRINDPEFILVLYVASYFLLR